MADSDHHPDGFSLLFTLFPPASQEISKANPPTDSPQRLPLGPVKVKRASGVARDLGHRRGARREHSRSYVTGEQRSLWPKERQPFGLGAGGFEAALLTRHVATARFLVRALLQTLLRLAPSRPFYLNGP